MRGWSNGNRDIRRRMPPSLQHWYRLMHPPSTHADHVRHRAKTARRASCHTSWPVMRSPCCRAHGLFAESLRLFAESLRPRRTVGEAARCNTRPVTTRPVTHGAMRWCSVALPLIPQQRALLLQREQRKSRERARQTSLVSIPGTGQAAGRAQDRQLAEQKLEQMSAGVRAEGRRSGTRNNVRTWFLAQFLLQPGHERTE